MRLQRKLETVAFQIGTVAIEIVPYFCKKIFQLGYFFKKALHYKGELLVS